MKNKKPLASLVVPTKGRYPYLFKLIDLLRSFDFGDDFELVIQDNNSDNSDYLSYIESKPFPAIKYYYESKPLPIRENCDLAIQHSTGEYVCFIGDDDCVTRNFMPCVRWMKAKEIDCVFPRRIMYFWPDYCDKGDERSAVHFEPFTNEVVLYNTSTVLEELLDSGCVGIGNIPMIYHGIVSRKLLSKIWDNCGTLFPGASPDIASGVSICLATDKFASFRFPIVVAGNSRTGGGGQKIMKHHGQTDFSKLPFLPSNIEEIWCPKIPKVWSNPTIWCESAVEALNAWDRQDLVDRIDFENLYVNFVTNCFYYRKLVYPLTNNKYKLLLVSIKDKIVLFIKNTIKRILQVFHIRDKRIRIRGIYNTKELCAYFDKKGYLFEGLVK